MSASAPSSIRDFDGDALFTALDAQRQAHGLSWSGVARAISEQSYELNQRRPRDQPMAASTIINLGRRRDTSCQHGLLFVQWLRAAPEQFLVGRTHDLLRCALPEPVPDRRPRWDLEHLGTSLQEARCDAHVTWSRLADVLRCSPSQIQHIPRARYAIGMGLAMRTVQWLDRPAADFVYLARR